jgi:hypothetical protein
MRHPVFSSAPLTSAQRSTRYREKNRLSNKATNLSLPLSAHSEVRLLCDQVGISLPALLLAAVEILKDMPQQKIRDTAITVARRHGLRVRLENDQGTHTRVSLSSYNAGGN